MAVFGDGFDCVKYTKDTGEDFDIQGFIFQVFLALISRLVIIVADIQ